MPEYGIGDWFGDVGNAVDQQNEQQKRNQLEWIAAINGQDVDSYLATQAQIQQQQATQDAATLARNQWLADAYGGGLVGTQTYENWQNGDQIVNQLGQQTTGANRQLAGLQTQASAFTSQPWQQAAWLGGQNAALGQAARDSTAWANGQDQQTLSAFTGAVNNAGQWDLANYGNLAAAASAPMQMNASAYVGDAYSNAADVARQQAAYDSFGGFASGQYDLTSQAASAQADPYAMAQQSRAMGMLGGAASGSLDVNSQAAQAYASAADVVNQRRGAAALEASGNGALDVDLRDVQELDALRNPNSIAGMADLRAVAGGSKDVRVGQMDPTAYAAQRDALSQLQGLTSPTVTAQEKLMYELSRQQQEADERGVRATLADESRQRGMSGAGADISRLALAQQTTSRNRMLQDMAAAAQAQDRAMQALQGYGTLASNMTAQANALGVGNRDRQLAALGQYSGTAANAAMALGGYGAATAQNNANRQLAAQQAAQQAYETLRAQGFSESYARGMAWDAVEQNNANRQLQGMGMLGDLSSTVRGQSFNESYSRGMAADNMNQFNVNTRFAGTQGQAAVATDMRNAGDAMNMFNQNQRQLQQQFSDQYTANRQDAQFGRQATLFDAGNTVGRNYMDDQTALGNARFGVTSTADSRNRSDIEIQRGLNNDWIGATQSAAGIGLSGIGTQSGLIQDQLRNSQNQANAQMNWGGQKVQDATTLRNIGNENRAVANANAAAQAAAQAERQRAEYWAL